MKTHALPTLLTAGLLVCGLAGTPALARDYAVVDSVQMPAWVERNGVRQPLAPGEALRNRDRVVTGGQARVVIALVEGSAVKLGENAQLEINALGRRENKVFTAAFDVARGAVRFTSDAFPGPRGQGAVNVRIATITAGIRGGTDLWGQADDERALICLLNGRISVFPAQGEVREMSEALSVYVAPRGAAPEHLRTVAPEQGDRWVLQTEVEAGGGYARRGGQWKVELASINSETGALALYDQARAAGYAVRIKPRRAAGGYLYSVRVAQLPSAPEANALAEKLTRSLALTAPVVTRQ